MEQWSSRVLRIEQGADEILRKVLHDGNRIYIGSGCGEPQYLVRSLIELLPGYQDIEIVQSLSYGSLPRRLEAF